MKPHRAIWTLALVVVLAVVAPVVISPPVAIAQALTIKGDQQAWAAIIAAYMKQSKVKSYRAKMTAPGSSGGEGTIEFANPDRYHVVMGGQFESVQVGKEIRVRVGGGAWQCTGQPSPQPVQDPSRMSGEVEAARGPAVAIDGVPTQSYTYTWKPSSTAAPPGVPNMTVRMRVFVANGSGLPKRAQTLGDNDQVRQQFDYEYDMPVTITLPACT